MGIRDWYTLCSEQASRLSLTSRAFHNDVFGAYAKYVTDYFGFDKVLPMNSGAEAVETAIKICRRWAYDVKASPRIPQRSVCLDNFHGRTTTIVSFSTDPDSYRDSALIPLVLCRSRTTIWTHRRKLWKIGMCGGLSGRAHSGRSRSGHSPMRILFPVRQSCAEPRRFCLSQMRSKRESGVRSLLAVAVPAAAKAIVSNSQAIPNPICSSLGKPFRGNVSRLSSFGR